MKVDILIPAAIEDVINEKNVSKIKAKYILSMANGPVTPKAEDVLKKRGIKVIPDILANAGGVAASYFEWLQSLQLGKNKPWKKEKTFREISKILKEAFEELWSFAKKKKTCLEDAAYSLAISRIVKAIKSKDKQYK